MKSILLFGVLIPVFILNSREPAAWADIGDRVVEAQVSFDTTTDDKDADTSVVACLVYDPGSVNHQTFDMGCTTNLHGRRFGDRTREGPWNAPITWSGYTSTERINVIPNRVKVTIRPVGHDTWRFKVYARWKVAGGDVFEGTSAEFSLSQDHTSNIKPLSQNPAR